MTPWSRCLLLMLMAALHAPTAQAAGARWAVVIGIDAYEDPGLPPLQYAVSDARAVAARLPALGFSPDHIFTLTDDDANREAILSVLGDELPSRMGSEDSLLVYWSGHGVTRAGQPGAEPEGYLMTSDGSLSAPFATSVPMKLVRELADRSPAKHILFLLDACYSGLAVPGLRASIEWSAGGGYALLQKYGSLPSRQVLTAGQAGERALEFSGHGLFTAHLLRALGGEADIDGDGVLAATELAAWMRARVTEASGMGQTPQYARWYGEGEYTFVVGPIRQGEVAAVTGVARGPAPITASKAQLSADDGRRWRGPALMLTGAALAGAGGVLYATGVGRCEELGSSACNDALAPRMGATLGLWGGGALTLAAGVGFTFGDGRGLTALGFVSPPAMCGLGPCGVSPRP